MKNTRPRVLVFAGYGFNCEDETKFSFDTVGLDADIINLSDIIANPKVLKHYQVVVFPGGFAYGDDTGAGKAYGSRVKHHLKDELEAFLDRDTLMLGICNGFQVLTGTGILPGALIANDNARYLCRWVDLEVSGESPWLMGIDRLSLPIAHGEGKYFDTETNLNAREAAGQVALRYISGEVSQYQNMPGNPNGSLRDIAGITAREGRVFGLMPHPERGILFRHLPNWTYLKEKYERQNLPVPSMGPGLALFQNAARYFE